MPPKVNKVEVELKRIGKLDGNRVCADCPEKMPTNVDLTNNVFLCTRCAGIHRDSQFKVKGISMSVFTMEDVQALEAGGNDKCNAVLLARLGDHPTPNGNDVNKMKDFIKMKYVDQKWSANNTRESFASSRHSNNNTSIYGGQSGHHQSHSSGFDSGHSQHSSGGFEANFDNNDHDAFGDSHNNNSNRRASVGGAAPIVIPKNLVKTASSSNVSNNTPSNRRASTGGAGFNVSAFKSAAAAPEPSLDLLTLDDTPAQSRDPFSSGGGKAPAAQQFDAFGDSAPATKSSEAFDPFGSTPTKTQNNAAFDPFANPQQQQGHHQGAPQQQQGFDAFGPSAQHQQQGGFNGFGGPQQHQQFGGQQQQFGGFAPAPVPMPYIKLTPPVAPVSPAAAPVAAGVTGAPATKGPKNFSVFDDLISADVIPPHPAPGHPSANPFDAPHPPSNNPFGGPVPGGPRGPPQGYPGGPAGYPPQQGYPPHGYPPQQFPGGYPPQGPPGGNPFGGPAYPPQPGYPQQGYPPQQPGYPGYPPQQGYPGYPPQQQYPPYGAAPGPYPGQPQPAGGPPQQPPQQPVQAPAAPDPFASMTGAAWNSVGGAAPAHGTQPPHLPGAPAPAAPQPYAPSAAQSYTAAPPAPAAPSVNPFDMF